MRVTLYLNPASAEHGYRVRAAYTDDEAAGEGDTLHADVPSVEMLRISGDGRWAHRRQHASSGTTPSASP